MKKKLRLLNILFILIVVLLLLASCSDDEETAGENCNHTFGEWTITLAPQCESEGSRERICSICNTKTAEPIKAFGHEYELAEILVESTCDNDGSAKYICKVNSSHTKTDTIPKLEHDFGGWTVTKPALCNEYGEEVRTCKNNASHTESRIIDLGEHSLGEYEVIKAAGCESNATVKAFCQNDGCTYSNTKVEADSALGHLFNDYTITKNATCQSNAFGTAICENPGCTKKDYKELQNTILPHSFDNYKISEKATCKSDAYGTAVCQNNGCDATFSGYIQGTMLTHSFGKYSITVPATCHSNAQAVAYCKNDGCSASDTKELEGTVLNHSLGEYTVITPATCTEETIGTAKCQNIGCDFKDTISIKDSALGHNFINGICDNCSLPQPIIDTWDISKDSESSLKATLYGVSEDEYTLTIKGVGKMKDFSFESAPWYDYKENIFMLEMDNSVTYIGNYAFEGLSAIKQVTIGTDIAKIGSYAFANCTALNEIILSAKQMGNDNFAIFPNSGTLSEGITVRISSNVERIPEQLFFSSSDSAPKILTVAFDKNSVCETIGMHAFSNLIYLEKVTLSNSIKTIDSFAFNGCIALTDIEFSSSAIEKINSYAFNECAELTSITLPDTVSYIGENAFCKCTNLSEAHLGNNITLIGDSAFAECSSLKFIDLGKKLQKIGAKAFYCCSALTEITLPDTVSEFDSTTFEKTNVMQNINGITYIDKWVISCDKYAVSVLRIKEDTVGLFSNAFSNCQNLENILIPASVKYIMQNAFNENTKLSEVYYGADENAWSKISISENNDYLQSVKNLYYYSEKDPMVSYKHWHYVDGKIEIWANWSNFDSPLIPLPLLYPQ